MFTRKKESEKSNIISLLFLDEDQQSLNGGIEAISTLLSAITVFGVGFITIDWKRWGNVALICVNGLSATVLYLMANTSEIWVAYIGYLAFRISYQVLMTIASFEIVKQLPKDSFGLIFGFNSFLALGCQTILSLLVNTLLGLEPKPQFNVYASYYLVVSLLYAVLALYQLMTNSCSTNRKYIVQV